MAATARIHLLQVELSGDKPRLHGTCVREIDDGESKVTAGTCTIEIDVTAAQVKPLLDKIRAEMAKRAALPEVEGETNPAKQFEGLPLS